MWLTVYTHAQKRSWSDFKKWQTLLINNKKGRSFQLLVNHYKQLPAWPTNMHLSNFFFSGHSNCQLVQSLSQPLMRMPLRAGCKEIQIYTILPDYSFKQMTALKSYLKKREDSGTCLETSFAVSFHQLASASFSWSLFFKHWRWASSSLILSSCLACSSSCSRLSSSRGGTPQYCVSSSSWASITSPELSRISWDLVSLEDICPSNCLNQCQSFSMTLERKFFNDIGKKTTC